MMKPVLSSWPPKKRTLWFGPMAVGIFLLSFLIVAFSTQNMFLALLVPPILAVGGAYALLGWPDLSRKDGKPIIEPKHKPYLFFVLAPLFVLLLYPILGTALTQARMPLAFVAYASMALAAILGIGGAYLLVGIPNVVGTLRHQYAQIPPERRPYLFFPIAGVSFLVLYLLLGVLSTKLVGSIAPGGDLTPLLNLQVIFLTPICLAAAILIGWILVGFPPILTKPRHHIPKVTGRYRPRLFGATVVLGGMILTVIVGAILTAYLPLPSTAILGLAVLLGFTLAVGLAALLWGTPARWREYEDYTPGVHPHARVPLMFAIALGAGLLVAIGIGLADIDLFWGLLAGALVAGVALLFLTGTHKTIAARRSEPTLVPDLPDGLKPLILFPTWILIAVVLFAVLTYALPGLVPLNALVAVLVGLLATFLLLEQPLLKDLLEDRRRERAKRKEWEARRKEKLAEAEQGLKGSG